jgi:hypothetical protein
MLVRRIAPTAKFSVVIPVCLTLSDRSAGWLRSATKLNGGGRIRCVPLIRSQGAPAIADFRAAVTKRWSRLMMFRGRALGVPLSGDAGCLDAPVGQQLAAPLTGRSNN